MLSSREKLGLLRVEKKRLVQICKAADIAEFLHDDCPVCMEVEKLEEKHNTLCGCKICEELNIAKRCKTFRFARSAFLFGIRNDLDEKIEFKEKLNALILEIKNERNQVLKEGILKIISFIGRRKKDRNKQDSRS